MIDKEEFAMIYSLHKQGHSIKAISKILNLNFEFGLSFEGEIGIF